MTVIDEKTKKIAANSLFPSLVYSALGLVLAQVGAAQMRGAWSLYVFFSAPGIVLFGLVLFRARRHWRAVSTESPSSRAHTIGWYLFLLAAGAGIGAVVSAASILFLGTIAALTYLLPWARIPVCRARFLVSSTVTLAGAVAWVFIDRGPAQPLYFLTAAWTLYFASMFMHILVLVALNQGYRIPGTGPASRPVLDRQAPLPYSVAE